MPSSQSNVGGKIGDTSTRICTTYRMNDYEAAPESERGREHSLPCMGIEGGRETYVQRAYTPPGSISIYHLPS
jgi:hypothetical protein